MLLSKWPKNIHLTLSQRNRILSSLQILQRDMCIDYETQTALIKSHSQKGDIPEFYNVSLEKCNCYDFTHRELPCKHIYALCFALERYVPDNMT
ncbi:MAG: SWIM zinc finger family protein [Oscillospiraceae bacterium]|nr:SWIM zinc finger family protein [Oscillospiraceae bacterium]